MTLYGRIRRWCGRSARQFEALAAAMESDWDTYPHRRLSSVEKRVEGLERAARIESRAR